MPTSVPHTAPACTFMMTSVGLSTVGTGFSPSCIPFGQSFPSTGLGLIMTFMKSLFQYFSVRALPSLNPHRVVFSDVLQDFAINHVVATNSHVIVLPAHERSEERRVGKECRSRG